MSVRIAPHNPYIFPQTLTVPRNPTLGAVNQGLGARLTAPNQIHAVADWGANGIIERGYVLRPWSDKFSNTIIRAGAMLFINRSNGSRQNAYDPRSTGQTESQPYTIVTVGQLNMLLEEGYNRGMKLLSDWFDRNKDLPGLENTLFRYLYKTEAGHAELFDKDGELIRDDPVFKYFYFFSKRGILERWNYLGFSRKSSAPDTMARGTVAYLPIDVVFKGPIQVQNIAGENSASSSKWHLLLKRKRLQNGRFGAFCFDVIADIEDVPSFSDLAYEGISGAEEFAHAQIPGLVIDSLAPSIPANDLDVVKGISPDATPSGEFEITRRIPYVWLMVHPRLYCKYQQRAV